MPTDGPSISAREAAVEKGRSAFHTQRHKHAIAYFSKAINSCPCSETQPGTREKCACKNYDEGVKRGGAYDLVDEIMRSCTCEVPGRIFSRCDDSIHNQALGYRAGCYEELKKLELARRDAEWALELYPLRIEAYLRLGKVARLQGNPVLAWQIYSAGVQICRRNNLAGDSMFQKLLLVRDGLHRKLCRLDPLGLPIDIIEQIFSFFDTRQLCACLRVSKRWSKMMTSRSFIWRHISLYPRARAIPGLNSLRRIVKYSGNDMRSLLIRNTNRLRMEVTFPALLNGSRRTTDLYLEGSPVNCGDGLTRATWPLSNLRRLSISSHMFTNSSTAGPSDTNRFLTDVLTRNADHIELISITSDHINFGPSWPRMEKLKYLKLVETRKSTVPNTPRHRQTVSMPLLWAKAPNIEHLWLDACQTSDVQPDMRTPIERFPHLKFIVIGPKVYWPCVGGRPGKTIALYRINTAGHNSMGSLLFNESEEVFHLSNSTESEESSLPDDLLAEVRHMYLPRWSPDTVYDSTAKACMRQGVQQAVKTRTLQRLAMSVYMLTHYRDYLASLDWLRGCPSIKTLSLFLRAEVNNNQASDLVVAGVRATVRTEPKDVGEFVRSFPNLETLEVLGEEADMTAVGVIIEASVSDGGPIKKVYQDGINGYPFDKLREYLSGRSVELLYGAAPGPTFPIRVE